MLAGPQEGRLKADGLLGKKEWRERGVLDWAHRRRRVGPCS